MRDRIAIGATICHLVFLAGGCARQPEPVFTSSAQVQKLKPEFQQQIKKILSEQCGRPMAPRLLGSVDVSEAQLKRGAEVYTRYCVQCHGVNGDGNGAAASVPDPQAAKLSPRHLQVHLDELRVQAAPRGPAADGPAGDPGHVDARVPACCRRRTSRRSSTTSWR